MSNEIMINNNNMVITNTKLRKYTEQIYKQGVNIKKSFARVAVILARIEDSKCYEQDGFESVHDYAFQIFGWKKANSYAMLKVGREYIDGKTYESILPHETGNDYSTSQLQALLPLKSVELAKRLAEKEEINPSMTVAQIKAVVKEYKDSQSDVTDSESNDSVNESDDVVEVNGYITLNEIKLVETKDGKRLIMCDDVVVTRESIISLIDKF